MRSSLFTDETMESSSRDTMLLQNSRMVKVHLNGDVYARQGSMVAYQGDMDFHYEGGGVRRFLKRAITGEGVPLMRVSGVGDLFLAHNADEVHIVNLEGDAMTINGHNVLAFEPGLEWDIRAISGMGITIGGLFQTIFSGYGQLAVTAHGTPVLLEVDAPTYVDVHAAVAWSSNLQVGVRRTVKMGAMIGRSSGEAFQLSFEGQGFVIVQASEGLVVPDHSHGRGGEVE